MEHFKELLQQQNPARREKIYSLNITVLTNISHVNSAECCFVLAQCFEQPWAPKSHQLWDSVEGILKYLA